MASRQPPHRVRPSDKLVELRPELQGAVGTVIRHEGDEKIVDWDGHDKPYSVPGTLLVDTEDRTCTPS
jgi:hypothetical protein